MSALLQDAHDLPPRPLAEVADAPAAPLRPRSAPAAAAPRHNGRRIALGAAVGAALLALGFALAFWSSRSASGRQPDAIVNEPAAATAPAAAESMLEALANRMQGHAPAERVQPLPRADDLLLRSRLSPGTPEARLLRVYALMAEADGTRALEEARRLAQDVPTFSLAHLVYADLLNARTAPLASFGAASPASASDTHDADAAQADRLKDLSAEAKARVGGATGLPAPGALPSQFVFVAPTVRRAIAVDASRSRLYVFENTPNGMVLRRDYYASVGKLGTAKRVEGDLRTPLGVYFVTGRLSKAKLLDRYGASAMVLNYPNQYDQLRGRTGSGIWLHGVEKSFFSRAPLATDGCVALSNADLLSLAQDIDRQSTPVVIADRLDWVLPGDAAKLPADFTQAFDAWRSARQSADASTELGMYASAPRLAVAASGPNWVDVLRSERARPGGQAAQLTQLSVLAWHDQDDVMLVTYSEKRARDARPRIKRQYWLRRDERWSIVFDGAVG